MQVGCIFGVETTMRRNETDNSRGDWTDRFGALASSLCAVHCGACALLPWAFGALGLGFLVGHEAEWVLTLVAVAFGMGALILGWRLHGSVLVTSVLALGIIGLLLARGLEVGLGHHDEHGGERHAEMAHVEHHQSDLGHHASQRVGAHEEDEHGAHEGTLHAAGASVGILGGLLLVSGHLLNIRVSRRRREACFE